MKSQITVIVKDDEGKMKETHPHIFQRERHPGFILYRPKWPMGPALNSGFLSMKRLGVLRLPPGWDASPSQGYPQHIC